MEKIKILEIINRWGYLNTYQIALLINKNINNIERQLSFLKQKQLVLINQVTRKKFIIFQIWENAI